MAWAAAPVRARLSDGEHVLWIGTTAGPLQAAQLEKVDGSRGPLTLGHRAVLAEGHGETWWALVGGEATDWQPPIMELGASALTLKSSTDRAAWAIAR